MPVHFLPAARDEFLAAADFYERQASGLGRDFIAEVERNLALLAANPEIGAPWHYQTRRLPMRRFPFNIVHQLHADQLVIVAVAHQSRRPGYWRTRISTT
jgi:plasmid stabilization system protein ParE